MTATLSLASTEETERTKRKKNICVYVYVFKNKNKSSICLEKVVPSHGAAAYTACSPVLPFHRALPEFKTCSAVICRLRSFRSMNGELNPHVLHFTKPKYKMHRM